MNVRIIGAGAVGSVVAKKLYGHADTAFIVDDERRERYKDGLLINGERIIFPLRTPSGHDTADLLIFAVKNFQLDDAMELETTCFSDGGNIVFGEKDNRRSERVLSIKALFDSAGQKCTIPDDIIHEKWWKFMLNTAFNTLSAILEADYAAISGNRDFIRAVRLVAREVQNVGLMEGAVLTGDDVDEMIRRVSALQDHGKTSMLQDVIAGRETENRYFAGAVSRLGRKHSIPTPVSDFISILLEAKRYVRSLE